MKKAIVIAVLVVGLAAVFSSCKSTHPCAPAYSKTQVESVSHS